MKILPLLLERIPHVKVTRYAEEAGTASAAINRLYVVEPMLENFAKHNNVDLFVCKTVPNDIYEQPKNVRNVADNMISLTVRDRKNNASLTTNFVVKPTEDIYSFEKLYTVDILNAEGSKYSRTVSSTYQDNFVRAFFRTFEDLVKQVKNQD